jgi:hypothetical protein
MRAFLLRPGQRQKMPATSEVPCDLCCGHVQAKEVGWAFCCVSHCDRLCLVIASSSVC